MLVLSRQRDETIMIGDDVRITILGIRGGAVQLGVTAPRHIHVHRKEIYDAIHGDGKSQRPTSECSASVHSVFRLTGTDGL